MLTIRPLYRRRGAVLPVVFIFIGLAALAALVFIRSGMQTHMLTAKIARTDEQLMGGERQVGAQLRMTVRTQIATDGEITLSSLAACFAPPTPAGMEVGAPEDSVSITSDASTFAPTPTSVAAPWSGATLDQADDLLRFAPARRTVFTAAAKTAAMVDSAGAQGVAAQESRYSVELRAVPFSAFSIYGLNVTVPPLGPDAYLGRAYSRGSLAVPAGVTVNIATDGLGGARPLVAGGSISVDSGSTVRGANAVLSGPFSTAGNEWLSAARTQEEVLAMTGRDLPSALITPASISQMTAEVAGSPSTARQAQELARSTDFQVRLNPDGTLTVSKQGGGSASSAYAAAWEIFATPNYSAGPVIKLDYSMLPLLSDEAYTVSVFSSTPGAIVLLTNVSTLRGGLSVVTNLPVYIAGQLNVSAIAGVSVVSPHRLTSVEAWF